MTLGGLLLCCVAAQPASAAEPLEIEVLSNRAGNPVADLPGRLR